jgi:hypothetical protein
MDITHTIIPKSDQLNADDLIGKTLTITITDIKESSDEKQPIAVHFENDNKKPYKPCKSMRRVMVQLWGADASKYVGRKLTLYREETVMYSGVQFGGIRISHASHISAPTKVLLTVSRSKRTPVVIEPIGSYEKPKEEKVDIESIIAKINAAKTIDELVKVWTSLGNKIQAIPQIIKAKDDKKALLNKESEVSNG